jgi:hypothetical protein
MHGMNSLRTGIIGGSHLLHLLHENPLTHEVRLSVLDEDFDNDYGSIANVIGDPSDYETLLEFGRSVDMLSVATTSISIAALRKLEDEGKAIYPSVSVLQLLQSESKQYDFLLSLGLPVANGKFSNAAADDGKDFSVIVSRSKNGAVSMFGAIIMTCEQQRTSINCKLTGDIIPNESAFGFCNMMIQLSKALDFVGAIGIHAHIAGDGKIAIVKMFLPFHPTEATSMLPNELEVSMRLNLENSSRQTQNVPSGYFEAAAVRRKAINQALLTLLGVAHENVDVRGAKTALRRHRIMPSDPLQPDPAICKSVAVRHLMQQISTQQTIKYELS